MSDSFQNFIDGINTYTLWDPLNIKFPGMGHIKIPDKLKDIKVFPMDTLMAELPVNNGIITLGGKSLVLCIFDFGNNNCIRNLYHET